MLIKTARIEEAAEAAAKAPNVIDFSRGLLGFENLTCFALADIPGIPNFKWLQSLGDKKPAFLLVDPFTVKKGYSVELNENILEKMEISVPEDVLVYTIVNVPKSGFQDATTNLVGPLVINWTKKRGRQIIFEGDHRSIKYPLLSKAKK